MAYGTLNSTVIPPTRSRQLGFNVLPTFGGRNDPREAGGGGVVCPVFNDDGIGS
jgi:hypothetical protein